VGCSLDWIGEFICRAVKPYVAFCSSSGSFVMLTAMRRASGGPAFKEIRIM
jgi:hypothetical protein